VPVLLRAGENETGHPNEPCLDVRGLFYDVFAGVVGRLDLKVTFVQLTEHPMPVEVLVVGQYPGPPAKIHRRGELTVQVWHPPA
jgi:hypothetical protein